MGSKLKIGLFSYSFPYAEDSYNPGIESVIYNLAIYLCKNANVTVYTSSRDKNIKEINWKGIRILSTPRLNFSFFSLNMFIQAAKTLKNYRYEILKEDILHDIGSFMSFWFNSLDRPSLVTFYHYGAPERLRAYLSALPLFVLIKKYSSADKIITPSEFSKQQLLSKFNIPARKIQVIPLGIENTTFNPSVAPSGNSKDVIIYLGVLSARKGPIYLIRAAPLIKKEIPDVKIFIIGKGPQKDFLAREAVKLGVKENIEFLGFLPQEDIPGYYRRASVTVMPSLLEGFGLVALESMACGTPVVSSEIEPLFSLIGKGGLFFPSADHTVLARQVIRILKDDNLRKALSKEAMEKAKEYSWENSARQHLEFYQQLLSEKAR